MFSRKGVVMLDISACTRHQIWDAVTRLYHSLPQYVRLVVNGAVDQQFTTTLRCPSRSFSSNPNIHVSDGLLAVAALCASALTGGG